MQHDQNEISGLDETSKGTRGPGGEEPDIQKYKGGKSTKGVVHWDRAGATEMGPGNKTSGSCKKTVVRQIGKEALGLEPAIFRPDKRKSRGKNIGWGPKRGGYRRQLS